MVERWKGRLVKINGTPRKHLRFWSIPKHIRELYGLKDGMEVELTVTIFDSVSTSLYELFGGGEFKLSDELVPYLKAQQQVGGTVEFGFDVSWACDPDSKQFRKAVRTLSARSLQELAAKASRAEGVPHTTDRVSRLFLRNPYVVAFALKRANGKCELCNRIPFKRVSDGTVYLEVHHILPLAQGGLDLIENVVALCPECHRFAHFGDPEEWDKKFKSLVLSTSHS
jgi:hypothetical protein